LVKRFIFDSVYAAYGFFPAMIAGIVPLVLILLIVYFPLTGLLGAWDTVNLEEFRKAAYMSGPSKWLVVPIYKILKYCCDRSPLHNKFAMPTENVIQDALELLQIKNINREELKERLRSEK
jgi:sorbitol-specific phosphotransferase system component IIC